MFIIIVLSFIGTAQFAHYLLCREGGGGGLCGLRRNLGALKNSLKNDKQEKGGGLWQIRLCLIVINVLLKSSIAVHFSQKTPKHHKLRPIQLNRIYT